MLEIIKEIILDFQNEVRDTGVKRHLNYERVEKKAFVCIGVRRAGKSTFLYQIISDLNLKGVKKENILYINFFDDRLTEVKRNNLSLITEAYFSLFPEKKGVETVYCFFDEIQEAANWEAFVDRILRTEKCEVFLTGSSSKMLSKELATQMRGRSISWELFPFSFKEFCNYKGAGYQKLTSKKRLILRNCMDEYFKKGGFPEVRNASEKLRIKIHQEYYKTIMHRDVIERFDAIHPQAVMQAGYRMIGSSGSLYSINRMTSYLKSIGYKVSKGFVSSCIEWFEDVYFLFSVKLFSQSVSIQNANPKKVYCVDHSLIASIVPGISANTGHLLENMIYTHLRRQTNDVYYYRTEKGKEIDFLWLDASGNRHLAQVCATLSDPSTQKREISSLFQAMKECGLQRATIVSLNDEGTITEGQKTIYTLPAWRFLIQTLPG